MSLGQARPNRNDTFPGYKEETISYKAKLGENCLMCLIILLDNSNVFKFNNDEKLMI